MLNGNSLLSCVGLAALSFGAGALLASFLPTKLLSVILAVILAGVGLIYVMKKGRC